MRHQLYARIRRASSVAYGLIAWVLLLVGQLPISQLGHAVERPSTAFYYANHLPLELLATYQRVVVEPDNVTAEELAYLKKHGVRVYAYFSIGEVGPDRRWQQAIEPSWVLGVNPGWKSKVMDLTKVGWRTYAINTQLQALKQRGFDAFFLDTLDSYQLYAKTPEALQQQQQGLVELLQGIKSQLGDVHLLFNRGFEIISRVANICDGVVAESLFKGWDPVIASYKDVNEADRTWLLGQLNKIKETYHLPIIVLDYLPPKDRTVAEKVAEKIKALGFIPWISTPALDYMGVGELQLVPRKVLLLYDHEESKLALSGVHRFIAMPLEYQGYVPEYQDIRAPLPDYILKGRYAGIVAWTNSVIDEQHPYSSWMYKQVNDGMKVAFMNTFPFLTANKMKASLKVEVSSALLSAPISLAVQSPHIGYEIAPVSRRLDLLKVTPQLQHNTWLKVVGNSGESSEPIFTADWGGMALAPYHMLETEISEKTGETLARWILNPMTFLKESLQLADLPVPDNTTENGQRILTIHIDGDGFSNKTELQKDLYSPEVIRDRFISPSKLPHTVSIIEGEIGPKGIQPKISPQLEALARSIFSLPNVEMASHSYSHPFYWQKAADLAAGIVNNATAEVYDRSGEPLYSLPIPGYLFSPEREVAGSLAYINNRLAPDHKKAKAFLWSGDALPNEEALMWAEKANVVNINGGNTFTRNGVLSLTNIAPTGIVTGRYFQPYAPVQNENRFTNEWLGPFYGYQEVINTFKLTDAPLRLKPIGIYYHFYSGDKLASVAALERVYDWAKTQATVPLWLSEYVPRVYGFREAVYERLPSGWKIHHAQQLKTLRLANNAEPPSLGSSSGIAGYKKIAQGLYLSLTGAKTIELSAAAASQSMPYLEASNAQIQTWQVEGRHIKLRLQGHLPVSLTLANVQDRCALKTAEHKILTRRRTAFNQTFSFSANDTGNLELVCE